MSTNRGAFEGSKIRGPVLAVGDGVISAKGATLGWWPSPGALDMCTHLEARGSDSRISIGEGAFVNNGCWLISEGPGISIGRDVLVGPGCVIVDSDFHDLDPARRLSGEPAKARVTIDDNVFLGAGVIVLKGVHIGANTVVGAGSVVVGDLASDAIAGGNPCRIIRELPTSERPPSGRPADGSVSIVVLAYNHQDYVEQALEAALNQSYPNANVLVFDDASSDRTAEKIRGYLERTKSSTRFIHHQVNKGLCATLNEALALCDTEYVTFISADDWMEPTRVEKAVNCLSAFGDEYGLVYGDIYLVNEDNSRLAETWYSKRSTPSGSVFDQLLTGELEVAAPNVLLRRRVFDVVGNYDERLCFEDYDMWLRIARYYKFAFLPEPLVSYRLLLKSMSNTMGLAIGLDVITILSKHLGVKSSSDAIIWEKIGNLAKFLYGSGRKPTESRADLWRVMRFRPRAKTMLYVILSSAGVPGSWISTTKRKLRL
jgi:acetyltransferase-like isoleucine patch superfamily enzyme/glycosyltransferase involved in cell wall biosynthesis